LETASLSLRYLEGGEKAHRVLSAFELGGLKKAGLGSLVGLIRITRNLERNLRKHRGKGGLKIKELYSSRGL